MCFRYCKRARCNCTSSFRSWINEYDEYGESLFSGHGNALFNSTNKIKKLQKQKWTENGE